MAADAETIWTAGFEVKYVSNVNNKHLFILFGKIDPKRAMEHKIDLFSSFILFSQCWSCDVTLESCFFEISSYSRAYVRIIYENPFGDIT